MYRGHHHPSFSLENCIILQNRQPLVHVPKGFTTYFINSKRRFFLYLKYQDELQKLMKIFERQNVKCYQRKSIFPDRQQNEEIVYHCNYKYFKKDLRWTLKPESKPREPRFRFNENKNQAKFSQFQGVKISEEDASKIEEIKKAQSLKSINSENEKESIQKIEPEQTKVPEFAADFGEIKIRSPEVFEIINNFELVKALFKSEKRR